MDLLFLQTDMVVPPNFTFSDGRTALPIILAAVFLFVKGEENVVRNRIFMDSPGEIQAFCIPKREGGPPQNLRIFAKMTHPRGGRLQPEAGF